MCLPHQIQVWFDNTCTPECDISSQDFLVREAVLVIQNLEFGTLPLFSYNDEICNLQAKLRLFGSKIWDLNRQPVNFHYICNTTESKVSTLDNVVLSKHSTKAFKCGNFLWERKHTMNDKHNWSKDYMFFCYNLQCY